MKPNGEIRGDAVYTIDEFRRRTGLGPAAWRRVRRELPIVKIGVRAYVLGDDWIALLREKKAARDRHSTGGQMDGTRRPSSPPVVTGRPSS